MVYLNQSDKSPFAGYLFTPKDAKDLRIKLLDNQTNAKLIQSYQKSIKLSEDLSIISNKKVDLCVTQVDNLTRSSLDQQSLNDWKKIGWFGAGVLTTLVVLLAVLGTKNVAK